jgi:hypothetical protein
MGQGNQERPRRGHPTLRRSLLPSKISNHQSAINNQQSSIPYLRSRAIFAPKKYFPALFFALTDQGKSEKLSLE